MITADNRRLRSKPCAQSILSAIGIYRLKSWGFGNMLPLKIRRPCLFGFAVICLVPSLSGVIVEIREWHGKQIQCLRSGLHSFGGN